MDTASDVLGMTHSIPDTICALASGTPPAGIAVIRISGPGVQSWVVKHIPGGLPKAHNARIRKIFDTDHVIIDDALILFMPAGASYTGEDVLELHVHGGIAVIEHALQALTGFPGIRLADPGEFTRRAFEAGRLDLTQAEGIADLIEAETRAQKMQAIAQAEGVLGKLYDGWRADLLKSLSLLELSVDFPDESEVPVTVTVPVLEVLNSLQSALEAALQDGYLHQSVRDGFRIAIIGRPNVGKSTLLNRLAKREAAIVTDIPGTTRDIVEVRSQIGGHIVWFADTAGLRETADKVEAEGIRRAERAAKQADLRLYMYTNHKEAGLHPALQGDTLYIRNKADLGYKDELIRGELQLSARDGDGIVDLELRLQDWLEEKVKGRTAPVITRARHRKGIETALAHIIAAQEILQQDLGSELAAEDVRLAARALSGLVGEIGVEDILGAVFSEFCIGK